MTYNERDYVYDPEKDKRDPNVDPVTDYSTEKLFERGIILSNHALTRRSKHMWQRPKFLGTHAFDQHAADVQQPEPAQQRDAAEIAKAMVVPQESGPSEPAPDHAAIETVELEGLPRDPRFAWTEKDDIAAGAGPVKQRSKDPQHRVSEETNPTIKPNRDTPSHRARPPRFRG
jgi:hypothetical protein